MTSDPQKTIFISYRRSTSRYLASMLYKDLTARGFDVFRDVDRIDSGEFAEVILSQIAARAHFMILLAHGTLDRCVNEDDWLRLEIERAVALNRNIIPVLVDGFKFEHGEQFLVSRELLKLKAFHAHTLYDEYYEAAVEQLVARRLRKQVEVTVQAPSPEQQAKAAQIIEEAEQVPDPTRDQLTAESYFNRGNGKYDAGDLAGAIVDYDEAIRLDPKFAFAYNNRGNARYDHGDLEGAIVDHTEAIRLDPKNALAYHNRGNERRASGDLEGAIADYDEAIRLDPKYTNAYHNRGNARADSGDLEGAIADYDEAIRLDPKYAVAYHNRGNARYDQRDYLKAIADYGEAIRLGPKDAAAYNSRAIARGASGDLEGAIADYDEAIRLDPTDALYYRNRARALRAKGDLEAARADEAAAERLK